MPGGQHAIRIAIAAVARQLHRIFDAAKGAPVAFAHQQRTRCQQYRVFERGAWTRVQRSIAGRTAVARGLAVAGKLLAGKRLMHHAVDRFAATGQCNQGAPRGQAADEGLGAVDRVQNPHIFGVGTFGAEFLAQDTVLRERPLDECAHGRFGGAIGGGDRIEAAGRALVFNPEGAAEKWPDGFTGYGGEFVHERYKVDSGHTVLAGSSIEVQRVRQFRCCHSATFPHQMVLGRAGAPVAKPASASILRRRTLATRASSRSHCMNFYFSATGVRAHGLNARMVGLFCTICRGFPGKIPVKKGTVLAFCAARCMLLQCGSGGLSPLTVALLGRFLPRLGPLALRAALFLCRRLFPVSRARAYSAAAR